MAGRPSSASIAALDFSRSSSGSRDSGCDADPLRLDLLGPPLPEDAPVDPVRRPPERERAVVPEEQVLQVVGRPGVEPQQHVLVGLLQILEPLLRLEEPVEHAEQPPDAGLPALLVEPLQDPGPRRPGDLRSRRDVEVLDDPVPVRHPLEDVRHQVEEPALRRLLEGGREGAARHPVHR